MLLKPSFLLTKVLSEFRQLISDWPAGCAKNNSVGCLNDQANKA